MSLNDYKELVEVYTGLSRDALHIYGAILIQIVAAAVFRRSLADWLPWLCVLAVESANEAIDAFGDGLLEHWEIIGAGHDLWNTLLIPSTLLLLARFAPKLMTRAPADAPAKEPPP